MRGALPDPVLLRVADAGEEWLPRASPAAAEEDEEGLADGERSGVLRLYPDRLSVACCRPLPLGLGAAAAGDVDDVAAGEAAGAAAAADADDDAADVDDAAAAAGTFFGRPTGLDADVTGLAALSDEGGGPPFLATAVAGMTLRSWAVT